MRTRPKTNQKLFIDVETVAQSPAYRLLPNDMQLLWDSKARLIRLSANRGILDNETLYEQKAGIYSEFSKVICISTLHIFESNNQIGIEKKSFHDKKELDVLCQFSKFLDTEFNSLKEVKIIGHNIKEFDIPFLARRMLINGVKLPKVLKIAGKKPWQVDHLIDTMSLWKFGDFKNYTSLNLLAKILNVPSPKDELDGSKIHNAYWLYNDIEAIVQYCEFDVLTTAKIYYKLNQKTFPEELINVF